MSTKLSIIILNHRADQRLERSLQSSQFADDVIIIDNDSHADWDTLSQHYHFTVVAHPEPLTDWAAVRNQSLIHALNDWVFFLDSDEVIHPSSIPIITELITTQRYHGALVNRTDVFHGKQLRYGEAGNMPLIRMGKKDQLSFTRPVHEEASVAGAVTPTDITLHHHSHLSVNDFFQKIQNYAQREASHRQTTGQKLLIPTMVIFPMGKFIFNYIFKLGFLDGWAGFTYAYMMSLHSLFTRVYQYEQQLPHEQTL